MIYKIKKTLFSKEFREKCFILFHFSFSNMKTKLMLEFFLQLSIDLKKPFVSSWLIEQGCTWLLSEKFYFYAGSKYWEKEGASSNIHCFCNQYPIASLFLPWLLSNISLGWNILYFSLIVLGAIRVEKKPRLLSNR